MEKGKRAGKWKVEKGKRAGKWKVALARPVPSTFFPLVLCAGFSLRTLRTGWVGSVKATRIYVTSYYPSHDVIRAFLFKGQ